jgi:hypothetical protein
MEMIVIGGSNALDDRSHQMAVARLLTVEITRTVIIVPVLPDDVWKILVDILQRH